MLVRVPVVKWRASPWMYSALRRERPAVRTGGGG